jgi:hypothetical protein
MAKVYVENISSSLYSRALWDETGATNYVVGDRVSLDDALFSHAGGTIDDLHHRIYICIADNNSTTHPFDDPTNWVLAGSSEEYPCYAVDGSICTNSMSNEVYLELEADRYSGKGSNRFTWNQATAQGTEHGELIFADGEYHDDSKGFTVDRINLTAKNSRKVSITTVGHGNYIFQGSNLNSPETIDISTQTGIKFIVGGTKLLQHHYLALALNSCVITDRDGSVGTYSPQSIRFGTASNFLNLKNTLIDLPNTTIALMGYEMALFKGQKSLWENCTFYSSAGNGNQYLPIFYGNTSNLSVKKCIFAFTTSVYNSDNWSLGFPNGSSENLVYVYDQSATQPAEQAGVTIQDPMFINPAQGDFRLRPSSPLIGGIASTDKRSEIENQYPQGKWFDSNAAAGGDGTWDAPYNNYGEAINSFTGDEAVILIKEGQHTLFTGSPDSSGSFSQGNDLLKAYSNGIKFIGMGPESVFDSASSGIIAFGAFWSQSNSSNPNSRDTPFLFKDFDILLNNSGYINRGLICCRRAEYINVNVTQAPGLGGINSQLFDYQTQSGSGNSSGEYLKMSGCMINVSMSNNNSNTSNIGGSAGGLKEYSGCTFADLNRTTSLSTLGSPNSFINYNFGSYPGSYIKDCIFYSKVPNTVHFGTSTSSGSVQGSPTLAIKNCAIYSTQGSVSIGSNYGDGIKELDPKFIATEPHNFDLRLRPDSPAIGGISESKHPADTIWVQPGSGTGTGTEDDAFYWSQHSDVFLAAAQSASKQIIFKDGTYTWYSSIMQDDNVGNNITMESENMHQAIFTDAGRLSSDGKNPTLRLKGIKLAANDHFTWQGECHYVFESCHILATIYIGALSVTASGCIFEIKPGANTYVFSNTGIVDIKNCIFVDHNDRAPTFGYLTNISSGTIKSTIFYTKHPTDNCINPSRAPYVSLINCASENITNQQSGIEYFNNLGFIDIENKNYDLRPLSPLIGQG